MPNLHTADGKQVEPDRHKAINKAYEALKALAPLERGLVLCWFCDLCRKYIPPGKACCQ